MVIYNYKIVINYNVLYYYVCIYIYIVYILYNIICIIMIELDMTQDHSFIKASPVPVRSITRALSGCGEWLWE